MCSYLLKWFDFLFSHFQYLNCISCSALSKLFVFLYLYLCNLVPCFLKKVLYLSGSVLCVLHVYYNRILHELLARYHITTIILIWWMYNLLHELFISGTYNCKLCMHFMINMLMRGMATLPQGNQELLVVKDKVGRPPDELGVSKSMECDIIPFSDDLTGVLHDLYLQLSPPLPSSFASIKNG